jgi:hypothetical protein
LVEVNSAQASSQGEIPPSRPVSLDSHQPLATVSSDTVESTTTEAASNVASSGVLLASEGTVQGESGWYHDGAGNMSYWNVDAAGTWVQAG